jgi:transposase
MLCWEEFVELRNLHERGWSVSAIARHLGKDRKTVRRYLSDPDARPGVRKPTGKLSTLRYLRPGALGGQSPPGRNGP